MTQLPIAGRGLESLRSQVTLLAAMQALLLINNVTLIAVNGLAGFALAQEKWMATIPITTWVLGAAIWAMPAAAIMRRYGRRLGYTVGSSMAIVGAVLAWFAMSTTSLVLLCIASFVAGAYNAFGASLRFAAADVAETYQPSFKARAISLVLAGGIMGGVIGPETAKWSRTLLPTEFSGTYLTLIGFAMLSMVLAQFIRLPSTSAQVSDGPQRRLAEILAQPVCWVAILCAALGYGVMNLLMVATPLAMQAHNHDFSSAALALEWHVIGMYAPGLFTGSLISRFGILPIVFIGTALILICVGVALSGHTVMHFTSALFILGVGWNFMYTGGSTLLTQAYRPQEKNRVQGFMDVCVFTTMISTSASSGALLYTNGWQVLNIVSLPFMLLVMGAIIWLAIRKGWQFGVSS